MWIDPSIVGELALVIAGLIALLVSIMAFRSYLIIDNKRFLLLAIAFFILSVPRLMMFVVLIGVSDPLTFISGDLIGMVFILFSMGSALAYALLVYLYEAEREEASVRVGYFQGAIGSTLIVAELYIFFEVIIKGTYPQVVFENYLLWNAGILFTYALSNIMIVLIIISLFAYYRSKGSLNTLLAMDGFIIILIAQTTTLIYLFEGTISTVYDPTRGWATLFNGIVSLVGFLFFLYAILGLKGYHGRR